MKHAISRFLVWLSRLHHCRGFGIQSPTDYAFVRYVINEHWPYYAYAQLKGLADDWQKRKLGLLYFRLANWRQPSVMGRDEYEPYWKAGCRKTCFVEHPQSLELARIDVTACDDMTPIYNKANSQSVLVVEKIYRNWDCWHQIERSTMTGVTFDLYYCGIVFFDKKRHKMNYKVNF